MNKQPNRFEEEERRWQAKKRERPRDTVFEQLTEQIDWTQVQAEERYRNKKKGKNRDRWNDDNYCEE